MAGNVSEWTSSAFHENAYSFIHDLNPDFRYDAEDDEPEAQKRKVIRGSSILACWRTKWCRMTKGAQSRLQELDNNYDQMMKDRGFNQ